MSNKDFSFADLIKLIIALVRTAYGDFTAATIEGARASSQFIKVVIVLVIGFLMLFTVLVGSLSSILPEFDTFYRQKNNFDDTSNISLNNIDSIEYYRNYDVSYSDSSNNYGRNSSDYITRNIGDSTTTKEGNENNGNRK